MKEVFPKPLTPDLATAILGVWKLKSREDVDAAGIIHTDPFLGLDPIGMLCFGGVHFAAQFMKRDRSGEAARTGIGQRAAIADSTPVKCQPFGGRVSDAIQF